MLLTTAMVAILTHPECDNTVPPSPHLNGGGQPLCTHTSRFCVSFILQSTCMRKTAFAKCLRNETK